MPKTDIKIYSTDAATGSKITTSVGYVNPNATNNVLKTFAQQLNDLTTNEYSSSDRIETVNLDTEGSRKSFRDITVSGAVQGGTAQITHNITQTFKGTPAVFFTYGTAPNLTVTYLPPTELSSTGSTVTHTVTVPNHSGWLYVGLNENAAFYSAFLGTEVS